MRKKHARHRDRQARSVGNITRDTDQVHLRRVAEAVDGVLRGRVKVELEQLVPLSVVLEEALRRMRCRADGRAREGERQTKQDRQTHTHTQ